MADTSQRKLCEAVFDGSPCHLPIYSHVHAERAPECEVQHTDAQWCHEFVATPLTIPRLDDKGENIS